MIKVRRHHHGFFSCLSVRLLDIVNFIKYNNKLPNDVDSSELFSLYKDIDNQNNDITYDYFKRYNNIKCKNFINCSFSHNFQYIDYAKLHTNNSGLINKYFNPSEKINETVINLQKIYKINIDNTVGVYYRGTDKYCETPIAEFDDFYNKIVSIKDIENKQIIIQTDTTQFLDYIKNKKLNNVIIIKENSTSSTRRGIHKEKTGKENHECMIYLFSTFLILSKCKYFICSSGNCSLWMVLYRGHGKNIRQFCRKKWYDNIDK
jgi:hypothetical protein